MNQKVYAHKNPLTFFPSYTTIGTWEAPGEHVEYGYDFWYQPKHNVMVSTEWGSPKAFLRGFYQDDVAKGITT